MKRMIFFLLLICSSSIFGQHFKLQHATFRMWTSQSNINQRGAEYRVTVQTMKKLKNLSISKIWIGERCFTIDALVIDNKEALGSQNITVAKDKTVKILINIKETRNENGEWILNSETCVKAKKIENQGKATIEYTINNTYCAFSIADFEMLPAIQYE